MQPCPARLVAALVPPGQVGSSMGGCMHAHMVLLRSSHMAMGTWVHPVPLWRSSRSLGRATPLAGAAWGWPDPLMTQVDIFFVFGVT